MVHCSLNAKHTMPLMKPCRADSKNAIQLWGVRDVRVASLDFGSTQQSRAGDSPAASTSAPWRSQQSMFRIVLVVDHFYPFRKSNIGSCAQHFSAGHPQVCVCVFDLFRCRSTSDTVRRMVRVSRRFPPKSAEARIPGWFLRQTRFLFPMRNLEFTAPHGPLFLNQDYCACPCSRLRPN